MGVAVNQAQLIKTIRALVEKGDYAKGKSEQFYISAGQHLKTLKEQHTGTWAEWETLIKEKIGIGKSRASELMQIADGSKTVESTRAETAKRVMKHSKSSPLANGGPSSSHELVEVGPKTGDVTASIAPPRTALLRWAGDAATLAKEWHGAGKENDRELAAAARKAADLWGVVADGVADHEGGHIEGPIKNLVARAKRWAREQKKQGDGLKEFRREYRPAIDALVTRLVALDHEVARGVFDAVALRGPCGVVEGVNFFLAAPFALALEKALGDKQSSSSCAAQTAEVAVPPPRPISAANAGDANAFIRKILTFTSEYCADVSTWHEQRSLSGEDRGAVVRTLYQCANEVMLLAQALDGRGESTNTIEVPP